MKKLICFLLIACFFACNQKTLPVSIIFDTDMAPDYDDVGALTILHAMADAGEAKILATVSSNRCETAVPCIEIINNYYNRPDIPLGAVKSLTSPNLSTWHEGKRWTDELPAKYPHNIAKTSEAPDAVRVYRKILAEQPDKSVTIVTVGFLSNLKDLLLSEPDDISSLSGKELASEKVKRLVSMAGIFPEGKEFNVMMDLGASEYVFTQWPTEIILSGFEIGVKILTGKKVAAMQISDNPVKDVFEMCLAQDDPEGRHSWDQTATLVAVRGHENYYDLERGTIKMHADSSNCWTPDINGRHYRLVEKMPVDEIRDIIETLMMHQPEK